MADTATYAGAMKTKHKSYKEAVAEKRERNKVSKKPKPYAQHLQEQKEAYAKRTKKRYVGADR